jgi:hypothetical protein
MVGRSSETLPIRVQILVPHLFLDFPGFPGVMRLSGKQCSRRRRGGPVLSPSVVLIGVGFAYMYS